MHIRPDFLIGDSGVNLSRLDIGMTEHLRYRLDGHTIGESHRCGECVPGEVESDRLRKEKRAGEDKT